VLTASITGLQSRRSHTLSVTIRAAHTSQLSTSVFCVVLDRGGRRAGGAAGGQGLPSCSDDNPKPGLEPYTLVSAGEEAGVLAALPVVKCLAFSGDGRLLAIGGEDGALTVLDWPTLRTRVSLT